jgi:hypothetical protein
MDDPHHPLFERYPLIGRRMLSTGPAPVPYHVYDGSCTLLGGTAALSAVNHLLRAEQVTPLVDSAGRALMGVWVCDFRQASLGLHRELQVAFFVSRRPVEAIPAHPLAVLRLLAFDHRARMLAYRIWNDRPAPVAYNREVLGLDARQGVGEISLDRAAARLAFSFFDGESGDAVFGGEVRALRRTTPRAFFALINAFGLSGMRQFLALPWIPVQVVNPIGETLTHNAEAQAYAAAEAVVLQLYDPAYDSIRFAGESFQALDFQPTFVEHMDGFRFVYLNPHNAGDRAFNRA